MGGLITSGCSILTSCVGCVDTVVAQVDSDADNNVVMV